MNPRDAEAALRKALELDPRNGCARIELGTLYEDQGRFVEAAAELEKAVAVEPNHGGAHVQLGRIFRRQGRLPEAEAALRRALEFDPQDGWARFELGALCQTHVESGTLYEDQGRYNEAAGEFERVIAIAPDLVAAHIQLGRIYGRQGRWSEAEAALGQAVALDAQNGCARAEMGVVYEGQGKFTQAVAEFERSIAIDPKNGGAHLQLGRLYRRLGRTSEAEAALGQALELDRRDVGARIELGALYENEKGFISAAAEFEKAIAIDRNHGGAHGGLGRIYRRQGRMREAAAALRRALELDPRDDGARIELGALYEDQGKFAQAAAEFERALAIEPNNGGAHFALGNAYRRQGLWREAESEFKAAIAIEPENDRAYMGLWATYRSQGRAAEAETASGKAAALNPRNVWACAASPERLDRAGAIDAGDPEPMRERVFCLLPWTHLHVRVDGTLFPCSSWSGTPLGNARASSIADLVNSPGMKALRLDMMSGRPSAGCRTCYEEERSICWSTRKTGLVEMGRHLGRERLTAPDGTLPRLAVPFLEIRFSNLCNLRCRMCNPFQSSAWAADAQALGLPVESEAIHKPYDDWDDLWRQLQPMLEEGIEMIHFVGGEPLIVEEHYRILDFLVARGLTDVRLRYNTNFSTMRFQGRDVNELWSRFRKVDVIASLDDSGRRGEYLRKGLSWDAVVANREEMLRRCPHVKFSIVATLTLFNALHLPDFHREWVEAGRIGRDEFTLHMLRRPEIYRMQVLPAALKERVLETYQRHRDTFLDADGPAACDFAAAARFIAAEDRSDLLPEFVAMTRRLDALRGEDCREVFPELAELFEAAA